MSAKRKGLGKGLNVLLGDVGADNREEKNAHGLKEINISLIEPNKNQPRKEFDKEKLAELTESIKQYGVLQPILVKKSGNTYEIIAGERRWRAARDAGLKTLPVLISDYSDKQSMEVSIIENIQRDDLNPIEEAMAYKSLMDDYGLKQEELANRLSKNRATIANSLRLLRLGEYIQSLMIKGVISAGHARAILSLEDKELQKELAEEVILKGMSVRDTERMAKAMIKPRKKPETKIDKDLNLFYKEYEDSVRRVFNTKVCINKKDKNKGRIEIEYYSQTDLDRIVELIRSIE